LISETRLSRRCETLQLLVRIRLLIQEQHRFPSRALHDKRRQNNVNNESTEFGSCPQRP
jgi:hypothetical protein